MLRSISDLDDLQYYGKSVFMRVDFNVSVNDGVIGEILEKVAAQGLSNLFIPARNQFVKVDALPVLGTGKLDLRGVKRLAMERLAQSH